MATEKFPTSLGLCQWFAGVAPPILRLISEFIFQHLSRVQFVSLHSNKVSFLEFVRLEFPSNDVTRIDLSKVAPFFWQIVECKNR